MPSATRGTTGLAERTSWQARRRGSASRRAVGRDPVAAAIAARRASPWCVNDRCRQPPGVVGHEVDDLADAHVAVGVVAVHSGSRAAGTSSSASAGAASPSARCARRWRPRRARAPTCSMRAPPELVAHRQTVVAGADDDHVRPGAGMRCVTPSHLARGDRDVGRVGDDVEHRRALLRLRHQRGDLLAAWRRRRSRSAP